MDEAADRVRGGGYPPEFYKDNWIKTLKIETFLFILAFEAFFSSRVLRLLLSLNSDPNHPLGRSFYIIRFLKNDISFKSFYFILSM